MQISKINNEQNFNGKIVVLGDISKSQKYLFNLHKSNLEQLMKNEPFDMFVKQSKSKKKQV